MSFYSHSDLGERRADTRKQLPVPIESPIQIIQARSPLRSRTRALTHSR